MRSASETIGDLWCVCLPKNVLNRIGLRPYLSDHGPMKKPMKAGIIFSKIARDIKILVAYVSTSIACTQKRKSKPIHLYYLNTLAKVIYVRFDYCWSDRWLDPYRMCCWTHNSLCTFGILFDFGTPLRSDSTRRIKKAPATPIWLYSDLVSADLPRRHHFDRHYRLYCTTVTFRHCDAIESSPVYHHSRQSMHALWTQFIFLCWSGAYGRIAGN